MFDEMRQGQAEKVLTAALTGTFRDLWPQLQRKHQLDDMRLRTAVQIACARFIAEVVQQQVACTDDVKDALAESLAGKLMN